MISALIAWGIGFGGVNYLPTHGLGAFTIISSSVAGCAHVLVTVSSASRASRCTKCFSHPNGNFARVSSTEFDVDRSDMVPCDE